MPNHCTLTLRRCFLLYLNLINGHELGGGQPIYTGPVFVLQDNAELVQELAANGTR